VKLARFRRPKTACADCKPKTNTAILWDTGHTKGRLYNGGLRQGRQIWCKQCIDMYVSAKMIPVETIRGIRGEGKGERSRGREFKYDMFDTL
jgi:hypothetical protein